jgi:phosphonate transport system substrate-binding protein
VERQSQRTLLYKPQKSFFRTISHPRVFKTSIFLVLAAGVLFSLYKAIEAPYLEGGASRFYPDKWINLDENGSAAAVPTLNGTTDESVFRVAVGTLFSPEKSLVIYQGFIDYLSEKLGRRSAAMYRPTYSETNDLVHYHQCDIAIVSTYPFILGEREFGMQALAVPQVKDENTYRSLILVSKSSSASSILDFRGKRFGSADFVSTTGWLFPAMLLMKSGDAPDHFFGEHLTTGSHDKSIQALLDGFVDVTAVHGMVYNFLATENPSIREKTRILVTSPPFGIPPIAVHPDMDKKLRDETLSILLDMHNDARGKRILDKLQIERFVVPKKGLFDGLRRAVAQLEGLK